MTLSLGRKTSCLAPIPSTVKIATAKLAAFQSNVGSNLLVESSEDFIKSGIGK
jgi:hypothetical protein